MSAVIPESQTQSKIVVGEIKSELSDIKNNLKKQELKSNLDEVVEIRKKIAKEKIEQAKEEAIKKSQEIKGLGSNMKLPEIAVKKIEIDESKVQISNSRLIIVTSIGFLIFIGVVTMLWISTRSTNQP